ncbi:MAG: polysaccharide pyruvyl transferase family protein [Oscillibacter sp.]
MCCSPAVTRFGTRRSSPDGRFDPVFFGAFSHKRAEDRLCPIPSASPHPGRHGGGAADLSGVLLPLVRPGRQGQGIVRDITEGRAGGAGSHAAAGENGIGRPQPGTEARAGAISSAIASAAPTPWHPSILPPGGGDGAAGGSLCGVRQKVHPKARCILSAGPAEFLGLFRDAAYVCTNSFHGTVFSVQFQKPFYGGAPAEMAAPESSRTFSLLSRLGLGERIIGGEIPRTLTAPIDWAAVGERLGRAEVVPGLSALRPEDRPHTPEEAPVRGRGTALAPIGRTHHCTGCTACASDGPATPSPWSGTGWLCYPGDRRSGSCVRCGAVARAWCALFCGSGSRLMPAVFAAWNRNDEIGRFSTWRRVHPAGGAYPESGGVVFGAAFDGSAASAAHRLLREESCGTAGRCARPERSEGVF